VSEVLFNTIAVDLPDLDIGEGGVVEEAIVNLQSARSMYRSVVITYVAYASGDDVAILSRLLLGFQRSR